tara:strand:+ start:3741 stop:3920 length:180 start_codon:yes stop_codon:yes gene_type:complete
MSQTVDNRAMLSIQFPSAQFNRLLSPLYVTPHSTKGISATSVGVPAGNCDILVFAIVNH